MTRRPSGSGGSWPSWRPRAWSPSPTGATRGARTRRSRTRGRTSRNPRNRPIRPTHGCGHPASARTPSSRAGISSASSAAALARRTARQGHLRIADPRGKRRMKRLTGRSLDQARADYLTREYSSTGPPGFCSSAPQDRHSSQPAKPSKADLAVPVPAHPGIPSSRRRPERNRRLSGG